MAKYTVYGSPDLDNKIDTILLKISEKFSALDISSDIHSLILGGGYGRGEGGVLRIDEEETLYNDLDFFVISANLSKRKINRINARLHDLHHELSDETGIDVDFSPVQTISVLPKAPFWLVWYELKYVHRIIYGRHDILKYLPAWQHNQVPMMEGLKLLLNRSMGLYFAKNKLRKPSGDLNTELTSSDLDFINRNIHKVYQGMGDAILISEHQYHWSNLNRINTIKTVDVSKYTTRIIFKDYYLRSMEFKLKPIIATDTPAELDLRLIQALQFLQEIYYSLWSRYLGVKVSDHKSYTAAIRYAPFEQASAKSDVKNLVLNLLDTKFRSFSWELCLRYPRYRLFYALPWIIFSEDMEQAELQHILGVPISCLDKELENRFVALWQRYN